MSFTKSTAATDNAQSLPDELVEEAARIKLALDQYAIDDKAYINEHIDELESIVNGNSGADNIGATPISGSTSSTVQAILEYLKTSKTNLTGDHLGTWQGYEPMETTVPYSDSIETFPIKVTAGLFDFSAKNLLNREWIFPDGSTSTDERPTRTLTEDGMVLLKGNFFFSPLCEISDGSTDSAYIGDLVNFPNNLTYYASFYDTSVTGDISALSNLTYYASFSNTSVTGDISALSNLTYLALFYNTAVAGDISALSNLTYLANFSNTSVTGVLYPHPTLAYLNLNDTNLSSNDVDQTVINLNNNTTVTGTLSLSGLTRTSASTTAINSLITKGWTVTDATVA